MLQIIEQGRADLSGKLDMDSVPKLVQPLITLSRAGSLMLDLQSVTGVDSAAIALLLQAKRAALQAGHTLTLQNCPTNMRTLMSLYALDQHLLHN